MKSALLIFLAGLGLSDPVVQGKPVDKCALTAVRLNLKAESNTRSMCGNSAAHRVRAVSVGIDNYAPGPCGVFLDTDGAVNDAVALRSAFAARGVSDSVVWTEENLTGQHLPSQLSTMLNDTCEGDVILFSWSGQASRDGLILANGELLPFRELNRFFVAMRNRGATITAIIDTSFASTLGQEIGWYWTPSLPADELLQPGAGGYSLLAAAGQNEFASESRNSEGKTFGAFSAAAVSALMQVEGDTTIRRLAQEITRLINKTVAPQAPHFFSTNPDAPLFGVSLRSVPQSNSSRLLIEHAKVISETTARVSGTVIPKTPVSVIVEGEKSAVDDQGNWAVEVARPPGGRLTAFAVFRDGSSALASTQLEELARAKGRRFAVLIGETDYKNGLAVLATPHADTEALAKLLRSRFGFTTDIDGKALVLENATRGEIMRVLRQVASEASDEDQVLIYFAGHGHLETRIGRGYWLPVDADDESNANWISSADIEDSVLAISAKHVLVISDSCFSGSLAQRGLVAQRATTNASGRQKFINGAHSRGSRYLLSSGSNEPVADTGGGGHSVFARALLDELVAMKDTSFTAGELFLEVKRRVSSQSEQSPQYKDLKGSGGGEFVFWRSP